MIFQTGETAQSSFWGNLTQSELRAGSGAGVGVWWGNARCISGATWGHLHQFGHIARIFCVYLRQVKHNQLLALAGNDLFTRTLKYNSRTIHVSCLFAFVRESIWLVISSQHCGIILCSGTNHRCSDNMNWLRPTGAILMFGVQCPWFNTVQCVIEISQFCKTQIVTWLVYAHTNWTQYSK